MKKAIEKILDRFCMQQSNQARNNTFPRGQKAWDAAVRKRYNVFEQMLDRSPDKVIVSDNEIHLTNTGTKFKGFLCYVYTSGGYKYVEAP